MQLTKRTDSTSTRHITITTNNTKSISNCSEHGVLHLHIAGRNE